MFLSFVGECHWCLEHHIYNLNRSSTNTGTNFVMNHSNSSSQVILIMFWESSCQFQEIYIRCLIKDLHGIHYSNFLTHSWFIFIYLNISKINDYPFKLKEKLRKKSKLLSIHVVNLADYWNYEIHVDQLITWKSMRSVI